ncbi:MAG: glycosyltransferase family 2 protein, partial [Gemmatimonadaceae bacterium]
TWCAAKRAPSFENAVVQNVATGCTIVINPAACKLLVSRLPTAVDMHDWWVYQAIAAVGDVIFDDQPSILYRQHGGNVVGAAGGGIAGLASLWTRFARRGMRVRRPTQLAELERLFSDLWTSDQRALVRSVLDAPTSATARLRLALGRGVVFQSPRQDVAFRILAALGRV